jgi:hypothetical protein
MIVSDSEDKVAFFATMLLFGSTALIFLWFVNEAFPFTTLGDDQAYFDASVRTLSGVGEWFDLRQFQDTHAQAGYPLLLSWVHQFCGRSLFDRKALNLSFFLLLAPVWYEIGRAIGGRRVAFAFATAVLLCTPLWFYWLFLLKDIVIVFLQSLLLLGLVNVLSGARGTRGYGIVLLSTVLIIPFRSFLALLNGVLLFAASLLPAGAAKRTGRPGRMAIACVVIGMLFVFDRTPGMKEALGVHDETGSHNYSSLGTQIAERGEEADPKLSNPMWFTLVYFVAEVGAFNPESYRSIDSELIRAVTMIPWIYFGLPLFLTGVWTILFKRSAGFTPPRVLSAQGGHSKTDGIAARPRRVCLLLLVAFVAGYTLISWITGDTTRWRMPSLPPMIAIAAFAWCSMSSSNRNLLLTAWGVAVSIAFVGYYTLIK